MNDIRPIPSEARSTLLEMFLKITPHSIIFNHAKDRVQINGSGRRHGVADCLDELRNTRCEAIRTIRETTNELHQLEQEIIEVEVALANKHIVRCPQCSDGETTSVLHERGTFLSRGGTGNPIQGCNPRGKESKGGWWNDCNCCNGEGVVQYEAIESGGDDE